MLIGPAASPKVVTPRGSPPSLRKKRKITVEFPKCGEPVGRSYRFSMQMNPYEKYACHPLGGVGRILRDAASAVISEPLPSQLLTLVLILEQTEAEQLKQSHNLSHWTSDKEPEPRTTRRRQS